MFAGKIQTFFAMTRFCYWVESNSIFEVLLCGTWNWNNQRLRALQIDGGPAREKRPGDKVRNKYVPKSRKTRPRTVESWLESTTIISYFLIVKFYIPVMTSLLLLILVLILSMSRFFFTIPFMAIIFIFGRNILY